MRQVVTTLHATRTRIATRAAVGALALAIATMGLTPALQSPAGAAVRYTAGCPTTPVAHVDASGHAPVVSYPGYSLRYCTDFSGTDLPSGWGRFDGVPGGDPAGLFEPSHVVVSGGILSINTAQDPARNNVWATGGTCDCSRPLKYGAFFVRSRMTGGGTDSTQLLWPTAPVWPPEVDFNETSQGTNLTHWYLHFNANNSQVARKAKVNLLAWHTWGVVWTPRSLTFLLDGKVWGVVTNPAMIPHLAMTLDLQSQTWCGIAPECPSHPVSMQVDWVSQFAMR